MAKPKQLEIKICGITRLQDAVAAVEAGATMLGLIFAAASPRRVSLEQAQKICWELQSQVKLVGVMQNETTEKVTFLQKQLGLHYIQYHGSEKPIDCSAIGPAIRAICLEEPDNLEAMVNSYKSAVEMVLIDRPKNLSAADWLDRFTGALGGASGSLPTAVPMPFLFAGGLNPDNVSTVVRALSSLENFKGVDVASGVEEAPGMKDPEKVRAFIKAAKQGVDHAVLG